MAYPREVEAYPLWMLRGVEDAVVNGTRIVLPCKTEKEARGLFFKFYALRRALIRTLQASEPHPLAEQSHKLKFTAGPVSLTIEHLEDSPETQELDKRMKAAMEAARK